MEQRKLKYDVRFNGVDRGRSTNYFHLLCWYYLQDEGNWYWEVQQVVDWNWSTKLYYSEKKVFQAFREFKLLDQALPLSVMRALDISELCLTKLEQHSSTFGSSNNELGIPQGTLHDDK